MPVSLNQLLNSYELWYVDINQTRGLGEVPFLQIAFTVSFIDGEIFANNNLVGFGNEGNGFGVSIGTYDAYNTILDVNHVRDGFDSFDVYQKHNNTIAVYNPLTDTSYFLKGYQRANFDYDFMFCDNIHHFLQEYEAWEKVYTSASGAINEFDNENYVQFLVGGNNATFRSSKDRNRNNPFDILWDDTGLYGVGDVQRNLYLKTLTLDYDLSGNEFFELYVINDKSIELYHPASGRIYKFVGKGYIQYYRSSNLNGKIITFDNPLKKRIQKNT